MKKISSIQLTNFRGFRNSGTIALAPLTFLVGPNSSGKSSIADGILLVAQSMLDSVYWDTPDWMGRLVDLGSFRDTVFRHAPGRQIEIELVTEVDTSFQGLTYSPTQTKASVPKLALRWEIKSDSRTGEGQLQSLKVKDVLSGVEVTLANRKNKITVNILDHLFEFIRETPVNRFINYNVSNIIESFVREGGAAPGTKSGYLRISKMFSSHSYNLFFTWIERVSSARSGPKRWVPKGAIQASGEKFRGLLDDPYSMSLEPPTHRHRPRRRGLPIESVSTYLLKLGIASEITRQDLSAYHGALSVTDNVSKIVSNLADVGYGASQAIPVIRGCLSDIESPLFLEQPEIHLHPKAQGELANLICRTSNRRQVIVETHSEHMINRARVLVAEGALAPRDVTILYVDRKSSGSYVTTIGIDESGDFTVPWPSGFFDERYQDTLRLLELKSNKTLNPGAKGSSSPASNKE